MEKNGKEESLVYFPMKKRFDNMSKKELELIDPENQVYPRSSGSYFFSDSNIYQSLANKKIVPIQMNLDGYGIKKNNFGMFSGYFKIPFLRPEISHKKEFINIMVIMGGKTAKNGGTEKFIETLHEDIKDFKVTIGTNNYPLKILIVNCDTPAEKSIFQLPTVNQFKINQTQYMEYVCTNCSTPHIKVIITHKKKKET